MKRPSFMSSNKRKLQYLAIFYFVGIHAAFAFVLLNSNFLAKVKSSQKLREPDITAHYRTMLNYHKRMDPSVPAGATLFIGDSLTQALVTTSLPGKTINYGIGQDTTLGVLKRIPIYKSLQHAHVIVLAIGINDLWKRDVEQTANNFSRILNLLPSSVPVIISAVMPVDERALLSPMDNARIVRLNNELQRLAQSRPLTMFINVGKQMVDNTGNLNPEMHIGDGLHINDNGYKIWINSLRDELSIVSSRHSN